MALRTAFTRLARPTTALARPVACRTFATANEFDALKTGITPVDNALKKEIAERQRTLPRDFEFSSPDFDQYRKLIKTPGIVDAYEKAYKEAIASIPDFQQSSAEERKTRLAEWTKKIKDAGTEAAAALKGLEGEHAAAKKATPIAETTVEEALQKDSTAAAEIEAELKEHKWN